VKAVRIHRFGPPEVVVVEDIPKPSPGKGEQIAEMHSVFFYAEVTSQRLRTVTDLFETRRMSARVESVLPLAEARSAHEILAGAPHKNGKIVLQLLG